MESEVILVGEIEDIEVGSVEHFEYEEIDYAIYHLNSGFFATQGNCVCDSSAFLFEGNINNDEIECPTCGNKFSIISGDPITNPDSSGIKIYDVTTENNELYLNI
tara:strand:+ start:619 stop:933 length:315 start_codon:yes stop_codon:yes gene_type:complete